MLPTRASYSRAVNESKRSRYADLPVRPDPGTVAYIVFGTIWYRVLATRQPLDSSLADDLVGLLTQAFTAPE